MLLLIVEDDADICELLADAFQASGFRIIGMTERPLSAGLVLRGAPDIALIDIMLNGSENGIEFAAKCREQIPALPIVAISASDLELRRAAESGHFVLCVPKPIDDVFLLAGQLKRLGDP